MDKMKVKHYFKKSLYISAVLGAFMVTDAQSQNRYSTWSDPNAPKESSADMKRLLGELNRLIGDAQRARAADPNFLKDLNDLVRRYQGVAAAPVQPNAQKRTVFQDNFSDGNFTKNPVWAVSSGKYWVEQGYGLRSFVDLESAPSQQSKSAPQRLSNEELVIGILGAVLGAQNQNQNQNTQQNQNTSTDASIPAVIYHDRRFPNSFDLNMDFSSWTRGGSFSLQFYQGAQRATGYKLTYRSQRNPALILERIFSNSTTRIGTANGIILEDEKIHQVNWRRDRNGTMTIRIDGQSLIQVKDTGFRDDFSGISLINSGGDFIVKSVNVAG